jgi:hypothetical protein
MTNAKTTASDLNARFYPAAHYGSSDEVLNDRGLSTPEKRVILSS